jgi:hypothetical protein
MFKKFCWNVSFNAGAKDLFVVLFDRNARIAPAKYWHGKFLTSRVSDLFVSAKLPDQKASDEQFLAQTRRMGGCAS